MPTKAWIAFGDTGDTIILNRTTNGKVRIRLIQGERAYSGIVPLEELVTAVDGVVNCAEEDAK